MIFMRSSFLPKSQSKITEIFALPSKGGFFSESEMCFSNIQKKIFQKAILNLKSKFPAKNTLLLLEIWRFEKRITLSEKKPPLPIPTIDDVFSYFRGQLNTKFEQCLH